MNQAQENIREPYTEIPNDKIDRVTKKQRVVITLIVVMGVCAVLFARHWWNVARFIVATDNAYTSADSVVISPRVSGYVVQVPVSENQRVHRGDTLVIIDNTEYQFRIDQANAALQAKQLSIAKLARQIEQQQLIIAQAKSALAAAEAYASRAKTIYQRDLALIDRGFVSRDKFDADNAELLALNADVEKARASLFAAESQSQVLLAQKGGEQAELRASEATLKIARFDQAQTEIVAPLNGVVGNRNVQIGEYVSPGKHLFVLVPVEQPYIIANFKETQLEHIQIGQPVLYVLDAYPGVEGRGIVQSFAPATGAEFALLPPQNATGNFTKIAQRVPVKIRLLDIDVLKDHFRPGLSATVSIDTRTKDNGHS